jgi:hypothetical protein
MGIGDWGLGIGDWGISYLFLAPLPPAPCPPAPCPSAPPPLLLATSSGFQISGFVEHF